MMFYVFYVNFSRASDFGLMKIDGKGRVISFSEKPKGEDLNAMVNSPWHLYILSSSLMDIQDCQFRACYYFPVV